MADLSIGTLSGRIDLDDNFTATINLSADALEQLKGALGGTSAGVADVATGFVTAEGVMRAFDKIVELTGAALRALSTDGAAIADVEENFERLSESAGRSAETMLGILREGTHNTINDFELMKVLSGDLTAGMNLTDQQLRTLATGGFAIAQAKGEDVQKVFETINDAMLTGRTRSLAYLTGKIDLAAAEEKFAKSLGTTVDRLNEEGKIQAARVGILDSVTAATERLGVQTDGLDEMLAQASTEWENFVADLGAGVATSPAVIDAFKSIKGSIADAFGVDQSQLVDTLVTKVGQLAQATAELVDVTIRTATAISNAWTEAGDAFMYAGLRVQGFSEEEADAMIATDHMTQKMAEQQTQLKRAAEAAEEKTKVDVERANAEKLAALEAEMNNAATERQKFTIQQSAQEIKKYNDAWGELAQIGSSWRETLETIDKETLASAKYYLEAGAAIGTVKEAFKLTDEQARALTESMKDQEKAMKLATDTAALTAKVYAEVSQRQADFLATDIERATNAANKRYEIAVAEAQKKGIVDQKYYEALKALRDQDIDMAKTKSDEFVEHSREGLELALKNAQEKLDAARQSGLTLSEVYINELTNNVKRAEDALRDWGKAASEEFDKATIKVQTLRGEIISLEEAERRRASGGSFTYDLSTQEGIDQYRQLNPVARMTASDEEIMALIKKGATLESLVRSGVINPYGGFGTGLNIPSFATGGSGDFGDGTLALLHGKEAIVPLGNGPAGGVMFYNTFNLSGSTPGAVREIAEQIMRQLKQVRQFGSA